MEEVDPQEVKREAAWQQELEDRGLEENYIDPRESPMGPWVQQPDNDLARGVDAINDTWNYQSDLFWNKGMPAHIRDEGLQLWGLSDEARRVGSSIKASGGGMKGLAKTMTGQGNLGGFRDPLYVDKAGAVSKTQTAGAKVLKNPSALQKIRANGLNTGMAALSLANAGSAGIFEATGTNYNPLSVFADPEDGSFGWHPESFGQTQYEMEYETDEDGNIAYKKDVSGNLVMGKNGKPIPLMRTILDENGKPIPVKNRRAGGFGGEAGGGLAKAAGIGEAVWNDLTAGGYDAMRANLGGVADLADMIGVGGDWSRAVRRNAREYVDNRDGAVDSDPLGAGSLAEAITNKIFNAYNGYMYPQQDQQNPNSL